MPATVDRAFELFTAQIGRWWPIATHSVGEQSARAVVMECELGGRLLETLADGSTEVWGEITDWDPPRRVAFTWHPGGSAQEATHVTVSFTTEGPDALVTLVHSGWDARPDGSTARRGYDTGWDLVLTGLVVAGRA